MNFLMKRLLEVIAIAVVMLTMLVWGINHGEKQGMKKALSTKPVSEELEMVCAGLWIGEQNKKYWEMERKK